MRWLVVIIGVCVWVTTASDWLVSYQGVALDTNANPIENGQYQFDFALFSDSSTAEPLWQEQEKNLTVKNGTFVTFLGSQTPLDRVDFSRQLWLSVQRSGTAGKTKMRLLPVASSLYSQNSGHARAADSASVSTVAERAVVADSLAAGFVAGQSVWAQGAAQADTASRALLADSADHARTADTALVAQTALLASALSGEQVYAHTPDAPVGAVMVDSGGFTSFNAGILASDFRNYFAYKLHFNASPLISSNYPGIKLWNAHLKSAWLPHMDKTTGKFFFRYYPNPLDLDGSQNRSEGYRYFTLMALDSLGRLGVGTISPFYKLDVRGSARVRQDSQDNMTLALFENRAGPAKGETVTIGQLAGAGYLNYNAQFLQGSWQSDTEQSGVTSITFAQEGSIRLRTDSAGVSIPQERMRITQHGKVGIGTQNPLEVLHVRSEGSSGVIARFESDVSSIVDKRVGLRYQGKTSEGQRHYVDLFVDPNAGSYGFGHGTGSAGLPISAGIENADIVVKNGRVGIGTDSPSATLDVNGALATTSGSVDASDRRFKNQITPLDSALHKLVQLQGVSFTWDTTNTAGKLFPGGKHHGVIAQDIEPIVPEVVRTDEQGYKYVNYAHLVPLLIESIKQMQQTHTDEIAALKKRIRMLEQQSLQSNK